MKTMLITGATSGIGQSLTMHALGRGYRVIACGRNDAALASLASYRNVTTAKFDLTNRKETYQALADLNFDIAVLNAGNCEYVDVDAFDADLFRRVFEINFFGIVHSVEALLPHLRSGNQLVIVDSMVRLFPFTQSQAYGASKAAVHYFTKSLEVDLAHKGITVQAVSPGFVQTPLTDKNTFDMPMKISADEAAKSMLRGIEKKQSNVFFPMKFGWIMRVLSILPTGLQKWLSLKMRNQQ
ncbi:SDR family NAD(P)-dependent oxidoreductase [Aestuariibacter sp. A3R04]|uniref:SDR family NAD(P)-dependent oxidoreductase n=1 Tax=Aestuariibacter sp. A3R04 TaxID=2841571 RepID=UPI001C08EA25|nr:SDR family NAD(P)-dependent oxidoreductase [Aestuariibacter sp. A3R04]MBU3021909.1 SDR family NAD(P)-dependent oxidoreductase [Aestuariibacter sp. A3R04]